MAVNGFRFPADCSLLYNDSSFGMVLLNLKIITSSLDCAARYNKYLFYGGPKHVLVTSTQNNKRSLISVTAKANFVSVEQKHIYRALKKALLIGFPNKNSLVRRTQPCFVGLTKVFLFAKHIK